MRMWEVWWLVRYAGFFLLVELSIFNQTLSNGTCFQLDISRLGLWKTVCFSKCCPAKMTDYGQIGLNHPPWIKLSTFPVLPKISKSQRWAGWMDDWLWVSILAPKLHLEASDSFWGRSAFFLQVYEPHSSSPGGGHQLEAETKGSRSEKLMANTSHIQLAGPPICRAEERDQALDYYSFTNMECEEGVKEWERAMWRNWWILFHVKVASQRLLNCLKLVSKTLSVSEEIILYYWLYEYNNKSTCCQDALSAFCYLTLYSVTWHKSFGYYLKVGQLLWFVVHLSGHGEILSDHTGGIPVHSLTI